MWMSHVTHVDESCHTSEWVMSHIHEWVMWHIWMSHVSRMNESCNTYEWVMSHIWMSHVTHMNEPCHTSHVENAGVFLRARSNRLHALPAARNSTCCDINRHTLLYKGTGLKPPGCIHSIRTRHATWLQLKMQMQTEEYDSVKNHDSPCSSGVIKLCEPATVLPSIVCTSKSKKQKVHKEVLDVHNTLEIHMCDMTHLYESCHTYEWVILHIWMSAWHFVPAIFLWVMSHLWMSHDSHIDESCHTYEWVMSNIWMSHVTHMNESCHTYE